MRQLFKFFALVFALLFIWSAFVQHNDPDALLWYAIYGLAALMSILFALDRLKFLFALVLGIGYLVGTFVIWPEKFEGFAIGEGKIENIERGREAFGLLIVSMVLLMYAVRLRWLAKSKV